MSDRPSVVVGISTYNRADLLPRSIKSALSQSHKPLRVVVTDDCSTDATSSLKEKFPVVSWERVEKKQGYVRARNRMMLTASEDYYVSLDDDAWFLEGDEIAIAVDFLERHPNVSAIAYDILSPDRTKRVARGVKRSVASFTGCGHVLRLSDVKPLFGYAIFPGAYGAEEKDLCLRLIDEGYEIVELEGVHVWHNKTMITRDVPQQHRSGVCNDLILTLLRFPAGMVAPVLAWKFAAHMAFALRRRLVRPCAQGMRDFVASSTDAWRSRRPVRAASIARYRALTRAPAVITR
jgi:glycosyltransferase involved in cell wall biosynthesis